MNPRTVRPLVAVILVAAATALPAAQARPDFSGRWASDARDVAPPPPAPPPESSEPGGPPPPPPPPSTLAMSIVQSDTELAVDRRMSGESPAVIPQARYTLDGTEAVNTNGTMVTRTRASWSGSQLVLSSVHLFSGKQVGDSEERYRMENGRLIVERTLNTPRGTIQGMQVFVPER